MNTGFYKFISYHLIQVINASDRCPHIYNTIKIAKQYWDITEKEYSELICVFHHNYLMLSLLQVYLIPSDTCDKCDR